MTRRRTGKHPLKKARDGAEGAARSTTKQGRPRHSERAPKPDRNKDEQAVRTRVPRAQKAISTPQAPQALMGDIHPISLLELTGWDNYALLDTGDGQKLEAYGPKRIIRPEPQALWTPRLATAEWNAADAVFTGNTDEEGPGRWQIQRGDDGHWVQSFGDVRYVCRFTSFRHVGVFPEQAAHWAWMSERIARRVAAGQTPKVLNLFGYTGVASLVAAAAGAEVTHVDASKKAVSWARENQALSELADRPIRWLVDDAVKFVEREVRRENRYDGVLLDPPKYGRGPKGEIWHLFEELPGLLRSIEKILTPEADFVVLTAYSIRASFIAMEELLRSVLGGRLASGSIEAGELVLRETDMAGLPSRRLSTSLYARWSSNISLQESVND